MFFETLKQWGSKISQRLQRDPMENVPPKSELSPKATMQARRISEIGEEPFAMKLLGINPEQLSLIKKWETMSRSDKIQELIGKPKALVEFHALAYAHYEGHKKKSHAAWKSKPQSTHLSIVKKIAEKGMKEQLKLKDFLEISMRTFFAYSTQPATA
jgi:predicted CopG family antitoxin